MKVYIASPYGRRKGCSDEECETNVNRAIGVGRKLITLGHIPFVPHLFHYLHEGWDGSPNEDEWLKMCLAFVPFCDCVLRLKGESVGADNEVALAKVFNKKVYYNIEELISHTSD